jgi:hypothetical protein
MGAGAERSQFAGGGVGALFAAKAVGLQPLETVECAEVRRLGASVVTKTDLERRFVFLIQHGDGNSLVVAVRWGGVDAVAALEGADVRV